MYRKDRTMLSLSFTNLRVYVDEKAHPIFSELTKGAADNIEGVPFVKMPDLFVAAACLGAKENRFKELTKKKDVFYADALDAKVQIPILISLAYKHTSDLEKLTDAKYILTVAEGWANGGIYLLHEKIVTGKGLKQLYRFVDFVLEDTKE